MIDESNIIISNVHAQLKTASLPLVFRQIKINYRIYNDLNHSINLQNHTTTVTHIVNRYLKKNRINGFHFCAIKPTIFNKMKDLTITANNLNEKTNENLILEPKLAYTNGNNGR